MSKEQQAEVYKFISNDFVSRIQALSANHPAGNNYSRTVHTTTNHLNVSAEQAPVQTDQIKIVPPDSGD